MNPWQLYDDLIGNIPEDIVVTGCSTGYGWTTVSSSEESIGMAMTVPVFSIPLSYTGQIEGLSLRKTASLAKSWNLVEAGLGVAAIGAYYNHAVRAQTCGIEHPDLCSGRYDAFELYQREVEGKKVAVIGHFPMLEERFGKICEMTILERNPQWGDLPDIACEYILGEQDYVFITGSTLVNKTMPRLLQLSQNAKVILVGPSTVMSEILYDYGVYGLSGFLVQDIVRCEKVLREGNSMALFETGQMIDRVSARHYINK
jgi:uncharacterized protein (DUF4213/DUF364 family)